jgi:alcohol dehydrogenase class IV
MQAFELFSVGQIVFGCGTASRVGALAAGFGNRALVVTNVGQPGDGGLVDQLCALLAESRVTAHCLLQEGEPQVAQIERALAAAREAGCELVIGLGGGSAIDAAKAVAGLLTNPGGPLDYMEVIGQGRKLTQPAAPWIAMPTTAGTGAEVTRNAVIGCPEKKFKASLRSELLLPRVALIDPQWATGVGPDVTARCGLDALCQLIESYTSNRAQPITDALALEGLRLAATALPRAVADGRDLDAREGLALAALLSGITLTNVGLGAVHGFAAPAGANLPIPHGTVCALLLPHVVAANAAALAAQSPAHPCLEKYATIGRLLTGRAELTGAAAIEAGVAWLEHCVRQFQIPPLREFGLRPEGFADLAALARNASSMRYNPVPLSNAALVEILRKAW